MNWLSRSVRSVRGKLIFCCIAVQIAAVCTVIFYSNDLLQKLLLKETNTQLEKAIRLVEIGISTPMAQRDYVTVQQVLDSARGDVAIDYLLLRDYKGKLVATSGWDENRALPANDTGAIDLHRSDTTIHVSAPVLLEGQYLGDLYVGLSTVGIRETSAAYLGKSIKIVLIALLASFILMILAVNRITRTLGQLSLAARRFTEGEFDVQVVVNSKDEISELATIFNHMAGALKQRIRNIEENALVQLALKKQAMEEQARFLALLEAIPVGIIYIDLNGNVVYANRAFSSTWLLSASPVGLPVAALVNLLKQKVLAADEAVIQGLLDGIPTQSGQSETELRTRDGRIVSQRIRQVQQDSNLAGNLWFHSDITLERNIQLRAYQALHDSLTQLVNRRGFYEALQAAMTRASVGVGCLSLLFIDLDDFKYANDVGGHRLGDDILVAVARALSEHGAPGHVVGRLGGDEFAVLCPHTSAEQALTEAQTLIAAVRRLSFNSEVQPVRVGCSIGVASYPLHASSEDELVACADAAMYSAKRSGKNRCVVYQRDLTAHKPSNEQMLWSARIDSALKSERLILNYQSVHEAGNCRITHFEALLRIADEGISGTFHGPAEFIIQAEKSGQIVEIDRWVLETVVARLAATEERIRIAANVSARSMAEHGFAEFIGALLSAYAVTPSRLSIELTETCFLENKVQAGQVIQRLRQMGCETHLDDFGSGFSSFAQLRELDTTTIKIDGQFIREMHTKPESRIFVESIIRIAHSLGKKIVAEHVESERDLIYLQGLGVDMVQGHYFSRANLLLTMEEHTPIGAA